MLSDPIIIRERNQAYCIRQTPMFLAMYFTPKHTIAIEFVAPSGEEEENRTGIGNHSCILPPSPPRTDIAKPTLEPKVKVTLPELPNGFSWQGVENIDLALPVPDGWFVTFFKGNEVWQNGLQEYEYHYVISQENPEYVGTFSPVPGTMKIWPSKTKARMPAKLQKIYIQT